MRAGLAIIAAFALCAPPVVAQGKTKAPKVPVAIEVLEVCESYASGDILATDGAIERGWDAYEGESETPFVSTFNAYKTFEGLGAAEIYVLLESYPNVTIGYCRMDMAEPQIDAGIKAIDALPRWEGNLTEDGKNLFGAWEGPGEDQNHLLLAHQDEGYFTLQATVINTHGAPFQAP